MKSYSKIGFTGFLLIGLLLIGLGIRYLASPVVMPYHLDSMESTWEELPKGIQFMSLSHMKSAAIGFLTTGIAILSLLAIPFRRGEKWSILAIATLIFIEIGIVGYRTYHTGLNTQGSPPAAPMGIVLLIGLISLIFSLRAINLKRERI